MEPSSWPKYFMAVGMDWERMEFARCCGHFHKKIEDAIGCISKDCPTIQGVDVASWAFGMPASMLKKIYEERGITLEDILPPGFPIENLPPGFLPGS